MKLVRSDIYIYYTRIYTKRYICNNKHIYRILNFININSEFQILNYVCICKNVLEFMIFFYLNYVHKGGDFMPVALYPSRPLSGAERIFIEGNKK